MSTQYFQSVLPIIDLDKNITPKDIIPVSPTNIAYYTIPAVGSNTGNASSGFIFNVIPPSSEAVLGPLIRVRMTYQVLKDLLRYDDP